MNKTYSMSGVKVRFNQSIYLVLIVILTIFYFSVNLFNHQTERKSIRQKFDDDRTINLFELFRQSIRLINQAGNSIRSIKLSSNQSKIFQKKSSVDDKISESVTEADLISHSILTQGFEKLFPDISLVSEEKSSIDKEQIEYFIKNHQNQQFNIKIPTINQQDQFIQVPLSSVAIWIDPLDATQEFTENLLEYVTVMLCITIEKKPTIAMIYSPFTNKFVWAWLDVGHSNIVRDRTNLVETHRENIDEIVLSRSHAGQAHQILKDIYKDIPYKIIPAAGSGYKAIHVLEEYSDYYLHLTAIKKWDICAPDVLFRSHNGKLTNLKNEPITYDHQSKDIVVKGGFIGTYKRDHQQILKLFENLDLNQISNSKDKNKKN